MLGRENRLQLGGGFAGQFEPDGDGFLYRRNLRGAPIRVTSSEREVFIETFERQRRLLQRIFVAVSLVGVVGLSVCASSLAIPLPKFWLGLLALGVGIPFMVGFRFVWNAPARSLERRTPVGNSRTTAEVRRTFMANVSWGQIAAIAGFGLLVMLRVFGERNESALDWWAFMFISAIVPALVLAIALNKIRTR
jgi:hypothetical protein